MRELDPSTLRALSEPVLEIVGEAMRLVRSHMPAEGQPWEVTYKSGPNDPLTEADLAVDRLLREQLAPLVDDAAMLTEEQEDDRSRLGCSRVWIIDPIDGTRTLVAGRQGVTVCVGLAVDGDAVFGALGNPMTGERFWAARGSGAHEVGHGPMRAGQRPMPARPVLLVSESEYRRGRWEPMAERLDVRPVGSTAYKMALVARGDADAYITPNPRSEWDVAAGHAIAAEAGARVCDLRGQPFRYNQERPKMRGVVVVRPELEGALLRDVKEGLAL